MGCEFAIIVHASGQLDDARTVAYWTEVPALAACASEGPTLEEAVTNTRRSIHAWLANQAPSPEDIEVRVELAY
jgi:predicted RNase H-like HicB family nuclease